MKTENSRFEHPEPFGKTFKSSESEAISLGRFGSGALDLMGLFGGVNSLSGLGSFGLGAWSFGGFTVPSWLESSKLGSGGGGKTVSSEP